MAIADTTYHSLDNGKLGRPLGSVKGLAPVRGLQIGNSEQLDTSSSPNGASQTQDVIATIVPDADIRVLVSDAETPSITVSNSRKLIANMESDVFVPVGYRVVVGTPS